MIGNGSFALDGDTSELDCYMKRVYYQVSTVAKKQTLKKDVRGC
ncbi:hypothetical protein [uncultured Vagococcus sp.]|nr:hypothetical protein [uncultured Vagococcus sp.]